MKSQIKRRIEKLKKRLKNDDSISYPERLDVEEKIKNLEKKIYPYEIYRGWI